MASWLEVLVTAFLLQLLALPGEKGQLVIAGLATKYRPSAVVAGATAAFGGWTILEILLGDALEGALPEVYLDAATAVLFVVFAVWILRSGPAAIDSVDGQSTDGGTANAAPVDGDWSLLPERSSSPWLRGFLASFSALALAEFGDKTQLITIGLAAQYGRHPAIWAGEMLAIIPVSALTAVFFWRVARYLNLTWVTRAAAAMFLLFAADIAATYVLGFSFLPL
ncbi:TMEM165/GDT1 family protein [Natrialbaceae archaeon GCM10025810]|uniref:TMEM165/GDT1 family protein n=1 Tax=Halovalidus salilacus TaxID=3075124 RepID=UPI00360ACC1C